MVWVVVVVKTCVVVVVSATIKGAAGSLYGGGGSCEFPNEKRPTMNSMKLKPVELAARHRINACDPSIHNLHH